MSDSSSRSPLLPDRHLQRDLFICDIFDAAPKGDMASMEHPIFSISTKPDRQVRRYENGRNFVEITPSVKGLATVHDRDVLIYCISQLVAGMNEGREISKVLRFSASELLQATNRPVGGESYVRLRGALERLVGTIITTNVTTDSVEEMDGFGIIKRFRIVRETREGRMQELEIELSDWVYNAISAKEVLTLSRDYFRLRKPLERRLYEIARKHCGTKSEWKIGLDKLKLKCGSNSSDREFRRLILKIVDEDVAHSHLPDYAIAVDGEFVVFRSRGSVPCPVEETLDVPVDPSVYDDVRAVAPGWDVRFIEQEWRRWCVAEEIVPKHPERHFAKFAASWFEKRGRPGT